MPKTIEQMKADLALQEEMIATPGIPEDEMAIYREAAATIRALIAQVEKQSHATGTPPRSIPAPTTANQSASAPTRSQEAQDALAKPVDQQSTAARTVKVSPAATTLTNRPAERTTPMPAGATTAAGSTGAASAIRADESTSAPTAATITAPAGMGPVKVIIEWASGDVDELTEGECRSRFTSALRDLAESRYVAEGRWHDLPRYQTFANAVAYYRGLTLIRRQAPTARELGLGALGAVRSKVFGMVTHAEK